MLSVGRLWIRPLGSIPSGRSGEEFILFLYVAARACPCSMACGPVHPPQSKNIMFPIFLRSLASILIRSLVTALNSSVHFQIVLLSLGPDYAWKIPSVSKIE